MLYVFVLISCVFIPLHHTPFTALPVEIFTEYCNRLHVFFPDIYGCFQTKPHTWINDVVHSVIPANHTACWKAVLPWVYLTPLVWRHFVKTGKSFPGIMMYTCTVNQAFTKVPTRVHFFFATQQFHSHLVKCPSVRTYIAVPPAHYIYSETCLERPLPWETTCLEGPPVWGRKSHIPVYMNLSPKTTCLERPYFCGQWGGLSRQILL